MENEEIVVDPKLIQWVQRNSGVIVVVLLIILIIAVVLIVITYGGETTAIANDPCGYCEALYRKTCIG